MSETTTAALADILALPVESRPLPPWILEDMGRSGIPADAARAHGWYWASHAQLPALLGFTPPGDSDALVIPFRDPSTNEPLTCPDGRPHVRAKLRVPLPKTNDHDGAKYLSPKAGGVRVFQPPAATKALLADATITLLLTEGEKKALAATLAGCPCLGLTGIWNWMASKDERERIGKINPDLLPYLAGRERIVLVYDSDATAPKKEHDFTRCAEALATALLPHGIELLRLDLPADGDSKVGLDDYLVAHGADAFRELVKAARPAKAPLPIWHIPTDGTGNLAPARALALVLARTGRFYARAGQLVRVEHDAIIEVSPEALQTAVETLVRPVVATEDKKTGEATKKPARLMKGDAQTILASREAMTMLPQLRLVTPCPVLRSFGPGGLRPVTGYADGVLARGGAVDDVTPAAARDLLLGLLRDFDFVTPADQSRAVALMLAPALSMAQIIPLNPPLHLIEADESQTGKGYLRRLVTTLYGLSATVVSQPEARGVGSFSESFATAVLEGRPVIVLDNLKGRLASCGIESFLTEETYLARQPHQVGVNVATRDFLLVATSNGVTLSPDLANRTLCLRIRKRPDDYQFHAWPEGTLLDHVEQHRPRYLGAVFALVKDWWHRGAPRTDDHRHDRREWMQAVDAIVRSLDLPPLLDGHMQIRARLSNAHAAWLRELCQAVERAGQLGETITAKDLVEIAAQAGIETPGLTAEWDGADEAERQGALKGIGTRLAHIFRQTDNDASVEIDGYTMHRRGEARAYDGSGSKVIRVYSVDHAGHEAPGTAAEQHEQQAEQQAEQHRNSTGPALSEQHGIGGSHISACAPAPTHAHPRNENLQPSVPICSAERETPSCSAPIPPPVPAPVPPPTPPVDATSNEEDAEWAL